MYFSFVVFWFTLTLSFPVKLEFISNDDFYYFGEADDIIPPWNTSGYFPSDYLSPNEDIISSATILQIPPLDPKWPNATVPYVFDNDLSNQVRMKILQAMDEYHRHSCVRFKPWEREVDYLVIEQSLSGECASVVGRQGGRQQLHLSPWCARNVGVAMHEFMHALGFFHEHMRPDRDRYVYINYSNIDRELWKNFETVHLGTMIYDLEEKYDFSSLMHYRVWAMSNSNLPTIIPLVDPGTKNIGQRRGFSQKDIIKLNKFYNCSPLSRYLDTIPDVDFQIHLQTDKILKIMPSTCLKTFPDKYLLCFKIIHFVYTYKHLFPYFDVKYFLQFSYDI